MEPVTIKDLIEELKAESAKLDTLLESQEATYAASAKNGVLTSEAAQRRMNDRQRIHNVRRGIAIALSALQTASSFNDSLEAVSGVAK